jgi:site-specific DNA-methyltransferase (adenine-specific)
MIEINRIYHEDCITGMQRIDDGSVDVILTDPPYLYLKNQKLDRPFDETTFFNEAKRVLKKDGFIVLFGRGTSFYRWNTMLADLGFTFKEEIIWDKSYSTSPLMNISRIHETVSIHTKGKGVINKVKAPYLEIKGHDIDSIITDIKRLKTCFNSTKSLDAVQSFLANNRLKEENYKGVNYVTVSSKVRNFDRAGSVMFAIHHGMNEKSIIKQQKYHYDNIHPTQKPVRLLERLLALVSKEGDLVLDPFSGSASVAIAAYNTARQFIGFEIDKEYYEASAERLNNVLNTPKQKKLFTA